MKIKILFIFSIVLLLSLFITGAAFAQGLPAPIMPGPPPQAPLGGLSVLAIAGGAYAIHKLRYKK